MRKVVQHHHGRKEKIVQATDCYSINGVAERRIHEQQPVRSIFYIKGDGVCSIRYRRRLSSAGTTGAAMKQVQVE